MDGSKWSDSEKKLSRRLFEAALGAELADVMAEFKAKAAAAATPDEMWAVEAYLAAQRREIDGKYDYRYSQLLFVFGRLVRQGRLTLEQVQGLSGDKRATIEQIASF